tara:strand:- start:796 stop:1332 length:537 start_codon:yes stop_codon:yes gene_type:complete
MNFQEIKLKFRMGILTLRNRFGKIKSSLVINSGVINAGSILIFLPQEDNACRIAAYSFRNIQQIETEGIDYQICVLNDQIPIVEGVLSNITPYTLDGKSGKVILSENQLITKKFGMILDLNPEFNLGISECIETIQADYKIGFQSKLSDVFYNIQIGRNESAFLESDYKRFKAILNLP